MFETDERDPRDVLGAWERDMFFASKSVQLRIPLRDPVEVRRHLAMIEAEVHALRFKLENQSRGDRSDLLTVQGVFRLLSRKVNAYRSPRR